MWAQIIRARIKPENAPEIRKLQAEFETRSTSQNTGWVKSIGLQNERDPDEYYNIVFFESEERARENEQSPEQAELVAKLQALFDGQPEYVDCNVLYEGSR